MMSRYKPRALLSSASVSSGVAAVSILVIWVMTLAFLIGVQLVFQYPLMKAKHSLAICNADSDRGSYDSPRVSLVVSLLVMEV